MTYSKAIRIALGGMAAAAFSAATLSGAAQAQQTRTQQLSGDQYIPTIWIDPDGCEHWVMDDGVEGYGTNRLTRQGLPVCHDVNACGVISSDQLFATDSARISASGRRKLQDFFNSSNAFAYTIVGHTDSRASDSYNMRLSYNRANAVAKIATASGARVIDVRGYGERMPVASNNSASGMAKNRRVEILCFK